MLKNPGPVKDRLEMMWDLYGAIQEDLKIKKLDYVSAFKALNKYKKFTGQAPGTLGTLGYDFSLEFLRKNVLYNWKLRGQWIISDSFMTYYAQMYLLKEITQYLLSTVNIWFDSQYYKNLRRQIVKEEKLLESDDDLIYKTYRKKYQRDHLSGPWAMGGYQAFKRNNEDLDNKIWVKIIRSLSPKILKRFRELIRLNERRFNTNFIDLRKPKADELKNTVGYLNGIAGEMTHFQYIATEAKDKGWPNFLSLQVGKNAMWMDLAEGLHGHEQDVQEKLHALKNGDVEKLQPTPGKIIEQCAPTLRWELLPVGECRNEAALMRHCGNTGSRWGNLIVSLREKVKIKRNYMWKPRATFILKVPREFEEIVLVQDPEELQKIEEIFFDKDGDDFIAKDGRRKLIEYLKQYHEPGEEAVSTQSAVQRFGRESIYMFGMNGYDVAYKPGDFAALSYNVAFGNEGPGSLGEMKGFANTKPQKKYKKCIMQLLTNQSILVIEGGDYKPEQDFNWWDDLTEKDRQWVNKKREAQGLEELEVQQESFKGE